MYYNTICCLGQSNIIRFLEFNNFVCLLKIYKIVDEIEKMGYYMFIGWWNMTRTAKQINIDYYYDFIKKLYGVEKAYQNPEFEKRVEAKFGKRYKLILQALKTLTE